MIQKVTRNMIIAWLKNYTEMDLGALHSPSFSIEARGNGTMDSEEYRLTLISFQIAFERLSDDLKHIAKLRWMQKPDKHKISLHDIIHTLNLSKEQYYKRCDQIVLYLIKAVNGEI